jgi:hypothetical protein
VGGPEVCGEVRHVCAARTRCATTAARLAFVFPTQEDEMTSSIVRADTGGFAGRSATLDTARAEVLVVVP